MGGWTTEGVGHQYGKGHSLQVMNGWMKKLWTSVQEPRSKETVTCILVHGPWNWENGALEMRFDAYPQRQFVTESININSLAYRHIWSTIKTLPATLPEPSSKVRGWSAGVTGAIYWSGLQVF
jgi:hypothetical protein